MSPYPSLLAEVALLLEPTEEGASLDAVRPVIGGMNPPAGASASLDALRFRRPVEECLDNVIDRLAALERDAAQAAITALLGLEIVLRNERASPGAADALNAALRRSPAAVRALLELERSGLSQKLAASKLIANPECHDAPQAEAKAPAGSVRASSLGNAGLDMLRRRATTEPSRR